MWEKESVGEREFGRKRVRERLCVWECDIERECDRESV